MQLVEMLSIHDATPLDSLTHSQVVELQTALDQIGFDVQGVDGAMGPNTRAAWASFKWSIAASDPDLIGPSSVQSLQQALDAGPSTLELSGPAWVQRFPGSKSIDDLLPPFRAAVTSFLAALRAAGVAVDVSSTLRPPQRAYLMHFAKAIAEGANASMVPPRSDVPILWVHPTNAATVTAAQQMVDAYGIQGPVALNSNHIAGHAIDMFISWSGTPALRDSGGNPVALTGAQSADNPALVGVGASYGVVRGSGIPADPEHWSINGA